MRETLHRYSTSLGLLASVAVALVFGFVAYLIGYETLYTVPFAATFAVVTGLFVFPRLFYGTAEAQALDEERGVPDPGRARHGWRGGEDPVDHDVMDAVVAKSSFDCDGRPVDRVAVNQLRKDLGE